MAKTDERDEHLDDETTGDDEDAETKEDSADDEEDSADEEDESDSKEDEGDSSDDESDDDDEKPLTAKSLKQLLKPMNDRIAVIQRHSMKGKKGLRDSKGDRYQQGKPAADKALDTRVSMVELAERKRVYAWENNLSPAETDLIFKFVRKPNKKTLEDPFIQGGLEKLRSKSNVDRNIPSGHSAKKYGTEGKRFDDLSPQDRQRNFASHRKAILDSKKGR